MHKRSFSTLNKCYEDKQKSSSDCECRQCMKSPVHIVYRSISAITTPTARNEETNIFNSRNRYILLSLYYNPTILKHPSPSLCINMEVRNNLLCIEFISFSCSLTHCQCCVSINVNTGKANFVSERQVKKCSICVLNFYSSNMKSG